MALLPIKKLDGHTVHINPNAVQMVGPAMQTPTDVPPRLAIPKQVGTMIMLPQAQLVTSDDLDDVVEAINAATRPLFGVAN